MFIHYYCIKKNKKLFLDYYRVSKLTKPSSNSEKKTMQSNQNQKYII
jgi:hypothetical protein